jgi:hypothetical protein
VWTKKKQNEANKEQELTRQVPDGWKEDNATSYWPPRDLVYSGPHGGPAHGPTSAIMNHLGSLYSLFTFFFQTELLQHIVTQTEKYGKKDWVVEVPGRTKDGEPSKHVTFRQCSRGTPGARHRVKDSKCWWKPTVGYLLAWLGIVIAKGAYKIDRSPTVFWVNPPYGLSVPWIQNAMPRDAFNQWRYNIHFVDNDTLPKYGERRWSATQKIDYVLAFLMKHLQAAYTLGNKVTIDESMVLYTGRAISWKMYMRDKPISHGIKIFCLGCAYCGVLCAFFVYTGKDFDDPDGEYSDGTKIGIITRLLDLAGLIVGSAGRILYTDNYYTSIEVMKHIWAKFRMLYVGVIRLTDKKSRTADDFPFHLLSKGAQRKIEKGWSRRATRKYTFNRNDIPSFTAQATTWKDKKQIGVLHNHLVEPTGSFNVLRYNKATHKSEPVPAPRILHDYAHHMGGIDHVDRDSADYSVSLKSERFYLRIFYWILNAVIHCNYVIVTLVSKDSGPKHNEWKHYRNIHNGRFKYQIDLSQQLIEYGIRMDWIDVEDDSQ